MIVSAREAKALRITEIMYDPDGSDTGREWIEIYNDESAAIQISNYKLNEGDSNHTITGSDILNTQQYAIIVEDIAKFRTDYPNYNGVLYRASYGPMPNSVGANIALKNKPAGATDYVSVYEYNYDNVARANITSGHTVCNISIDTLSADWRECNATPGLANVGIGEPITNTNSTSSSSSTISNTNNISSSTLSNNMIPVGVNYYVPNPNIYIKVGDMNVESIKNKTVMAGTEFELLVRAYNQNGMAINSPKYYWSMGDGGYYEGEKIKYIYHVPGDYEFTVDAGNDNSYSMYRGNIKVVTPNMKIIEASTTMNIIIIKNNSNAELDMGGYLIRDDKSNKSYKIARNTFIKPNSELRLFGYAMGFVSTSSEYYSLWSPNNLLLSRYMRELTSSVIDVSTFTARATNTMLVRASTTTKIINATATSTPKNKFNPATVNKRKTISYTQKLYFGSRY